MAACGFFRCRFGSGVASAAAIGKIMALLHAGGGDPAGLTAGLIAAGGTMACIIPPSIVMVAYAQSASVSVGRYVPRRRGPPRPVDHHRPIALNSFFAVRRQKKENKDPYEYSCHERMKIILDALLPLLMPVAILGGVFPVCAPLPRPLSVGCGLRAVFLPVRYCELTLKGLLQGVC